MPLVAEAIRKEVAGQVVRILLSGAVDWPVLLEWRVGFRNAKDKAIQGGGK